MSRYASCERQGAVGILRFANPPTGLISNRGAAELATHLQELLDDAAIRAIVLTGGAAGVFIRHADVAQIVRAANALATGEIAPDSFLEAPFPRLAALLDRAQKPVIAAINGTCMGGGFEIALACSARIASRDARAIGLPEIRIGIFPGAGGTARLARIIGNHRARLFILQGRVVDAAEALALGLVDELADDALERALALAAELAARAPAAVAAVMRLMAAHEAPALMDNLDAFARLLRDDPSARERMRGFLAAGEALDAID